MFICNDCESLFDIGMVAWDDEGNTKLCPYCYSDNLGGV